MTTKKENQEVIAQVIGSIVDIATRSYLAETHYHDMHFLTGGDTAPELAECEAIYYDGLHLIGHAVDDFGLTKLQVERAIEAGRAIGEIIGSTVAGMKF